MVRPETLKGPGRGAARPGERSVQARSDKPSTATENRERRARGKRATGVGTGKLWRVCPAGLTRRTRRTTKVHEGLPGGEPQISQIWSRLRACYRTQDCQNIFTGHKGNWLIGRLADWVWGAAPRPGRGRHPLHPQARLRRANRRRSGDAGDTGDSGAPASGRRVKRRAEKPNFQASKLPNFQIKKAPASAGAFWFDATLISRFWGRRGRLCTWDRSRP